MRLIEVILIAVSLAMDATAVSMAAGASGRARGRRAAFRLSFHFGLFQFLMPVIGWFGGRAVADRMASVDHWIAFALLAFVGVRMVRSGLAGRPESASADPSRGWSLLVLALATSIDALAVGLGLAMIGIRIWTPALVIGVITAAMSLIGLAVGQRAGTRFGPRMETIGGLVLIMIGGKIVFEHLLG